MENKNKILLWLDDRRDPFERDWQDWIFERITIVPPFEIVWVKSYDTFTEWIIKNGLPSMIFWDHDLGKDVANEKIKNGMSKRQAKKERRETKSGMDAAKWLVKYCLDNNLELPLYLIQSDNPGGKANIDSYLQSFNNRNNK